MAVTAYKPNWKKYQQNAVTPAQLDELMKFVTESGGGMVGAIIAAIKIAVIGAYLTARGKLVQQNMMIEKQDFEAALASHHGNQNEINN